MTAEKPKPFTFFIRGLQMTTVVERMFHVDSAAERAGWLEAIERVKKKLDEVRIAGFLCWQPQTLLFQDIVCASVDVDMPKVDEGLTDPFETIFAKRGEVQKRSGSRKLVSLIFISLWQFIIEICVGNSDCVNALFIDSQSPEHINGENDRRTGGKFVQIVFSFKLFSLALLSLSKVALSSYWYFLTSSQIFWHEN